MPDQSGDPVVHVLWMNAGLSCDGDSVSLTAATLPSVEEIAMGAMPGLPKVQFHWPLVDFEVGEDFMQLVPCMPKPASSTPLYSSSKDR